MSMFGGGRLGFYHQKTGGGGDIPQKNAPNSPKTDEFLHLIAHFREIVWYRIRVGYNTTGDADMKNFQIEYYYDKTLLTAARINQSTVDRLDEPSHCDTYPLCRQLGLIARLTLVAEYATDAAFIAARVPYDDIETLELLAENLIAWLADGIYPDSEESLRAVDEYLIKYPDSDIWQLSLSEILHIYDQIDIDLNLVWARTNGFALGVQRGDAIFYLIIEADNLSRLCIFTNREQDLTADLVDEFIFVAGRFLAAHFLPRPSQYEVYEIDC